MSGPRSLATILAGASFVALVLAMPACVNFSQDFATYCADGGCPSSEDAGSEDAGPFDAGLDAGALPALGTVVMEPNGGPPHQARQGSAPVLTIGFGELTGVEDAGLEGLTGVLQVNPDAGTFRLSFAVPHGAAIGPRDLFVTSSGATYRYPSFVEVTPITAALETGSDDAGTGTAFAPYRSFARAELEAAGGDTIWLRAGTWPLFGEEHQSPPTATIQKAITLLGDGRGMTVLVPSTDAGRPDGPCVDSDVTLRAMTLQGYTYGAIVRDTSLAVPGTLTLDDVELIAPNPTDSTGVLVDADGTRALLNDTSITGYQWGAQCMFQSTHLDVDGGTFDSPSGYEAVSLFSHCAATLRNTTISGGTYGVFAADFTSAALFGGSISDVDVGVALSGPPSVQLHGASISAAGTGVFANGSWDFCASLLVDGGTITSPDTGIQLGQVCPADLEGVQITGTNYGIASAGSGNVRLRNAHLVGNHVALYLFSQQGIDGGAVDLGTGSDPGNNDFRGNGTCALWDDRDDGSLETTVSASTFGVDGGLAPDAGQDLGPVDRCPDLWRIKGANTVHVF